MASASQDIDFQAGARTSAVSKPGNSSRDNDDDANDDNANDDAEDDLEPIILIQNSPRRTYLITYSQVDKRTFPSREAFAKVCAQACGVIKW